MSIKDLSFQFPLMIHPSSLIGEDNLYKSWGNKFNTEKEKTISEVAEELEDRFNVINTFCQMHNKDISGILSKELALNVLGKQTEEQMQEISSAKIATLFREYLRKEEHGIHTKAAAKRHGKSFIDTTAYMQGIYTRIVGDTYE